MPKNTGVGSLSLLQQIFTTQKLNWGLLHCRRFFTNWAIREAQTFYKTMNSDIWIRSTDVTKFTGSCYVCSKATLWIINHSFEGLYVVPRRRQWQPTPVLLPVKSHGRRSLVGCSPWGREESDTTERLHFHFPALEKEMATHSSVLAWRIPGTGEPGGLPSLGSHRVGHDWSDLAVAAVGCCS